MTHPRTRLLWQDVTVFDGQETLPDAMAVIVEDDRIQSLIPMRELSSEHAETCRLMGSGGVMTPGWSIAIPIWCSGAVAPTSSRHVWKAQATRKSPGVVVASSAPCATHAQPARRSCSPPPCRVSMPCSPMA
ncbi:hypothetical protein A8U91_00870 [Halomonas elongata]|uniref:Uncharacterized protein n=1 Tax=Halomonas elongata TaxID=2746 RepID=A0A1B8P2P9_HALEL|nr:hypothetical protein [Halomonas elongata]OBX36527.1 hypothetical protein A8U91_00870 [Halomonas elongata]